MKKKSVSNIVLHILAWSIYLFMPLFVFPRSSEFLRSNQENLIIYAAMGILSILYFYFNYIFTIPRYFFSKEYLRFAVLNILYLLAALSITRLLAQVFVDRTQFQEAYRLAFAGNFILRFLLIFVIALTMRYREESKKLETERIKAELSSLKSQVNPHFLFNTLNGIYGQALGRSELTADSIARLSSLMRYVLTEASNELVNLDHEVEYIRNYIHLQRIRLTEKTEIIFDIQGETHLHSVPPLIFINFIENAFKYGVSTEVPSIVEIHLIAEENRIFFSVKNRKLRPEGRQALNSQIGLENSKRRLVLSYGSRHKLDILENEEYFTVNLTIG